MTAVSQSYPNYLGGLNEQPDELKKPGQLVEALNVIPDPVIGLTRRPGFELIETIEDIEPGGTWFELEATNLINNNYIYFGHVNPSSGDVIIFNQDGVRQEVLYTADGVSILPHKQYKLISDTELEVIDENNETIWYEEPNADGTGGIKYVPVGPSTTNGYFKHNPTQPLKYCISKSHIIFTNPKDTPTLAGADDVEGSNKYYSFINLKVIDVENYNYTFRRFYADDDTDTYTYIKDIGLDSIEDLGAGWDEDLTMPLQTQGPFRFNIEPNDSTASVKEDAIVEVTFRGQAVQLQSSDGDGYRNEARYTWNVKIIDPGKGFKKGNKLEILPALNSSEPDVTLTDLRLNFKIDEVTKVTATKNELVVPDDLSNNNSAEDILLELADKFKQSGIDKVIVVGSGIYLENSDPFSISTSEIAVADVLNSQKMEENNDKVPIVRVNTVAELPVECYPGFIVQVTNTFDERNGYFLKYIAESEVDEDDTAGTPVLTKADGYWEEIAKPFEQHNPQNGTLPHMITAVTDEETAEITFIVSSISYEMRTAGTALANPSIFLDKAKITAVNYYKNRLFFLTSVGTVVTSRAGEINNLFLNTAVEASLIDPIDLIANSNQRVPIHSSAVVNNGLVMFGDSEQYSMTTSNDVLTTETAGITKISNYTFEPMSDPIYLGTNLGFISGGLSKLYEMTNVYDRGPVDINERSQQIQSQFSLGFNMPVSSREQSQVIVYKRYTSSGSKDMYMYRFRQESSQDSSQTAWVKWSVDEPILYVSMPRDKMFVVLASGKLYRMQGNTLEGLPATAPALPPVFLDGWTDRNTGIKFVSRVKFPTIYPRGKESYDITANTTIHRVKLSTSAIGLYNLDIERHGYDTYTIQVEQTPADDGSWGANIPTLRGKHIETIPIYTRNENLTLTMYTDDNAPFALNSMTWEGDWNPPYYKRV